MDKKINFFKNLILILSILFSMNLIFATTNVVDVIINESAYEYITYDPTVSGSGIYYDANENQLQYALSGIITIKNKHSTQTVQKIILNISSPNIYNLTFSSGAQGFVTSIDSINNYSIITIPDLGPGFNTTFTYVINTTNIAPPLNFTTSYANTKTFAGLPFRITDKIQNNLNSIAYPINCIYGINITQNAMTAIVNGTSYNFTYIPSTKAGNDSSNVTFDGLNRTLYWNTLGAKCLNSTNSTDINYEILTPALLPVSGTYGIINTTIRYNLNTTVSKISVESINGLLNVQSQFEKYMNNTLTGNNASWKISSSVSNSANITINLTQVTLWVSVRNGTGTGFTNPSLIDNDTISGSLLLKTINPNVLLNSTTGNWSNTGSEWYFNSTFAPSPIVWMSLENEILDDGTQLTNQTFTYSNSTVYVKNVYISTGYWLQVTKNITKLSEGNYSIQVTVLNRGSAVTPPNQIVMVYNFIPNTFNLTSPMVYSVSTWYSTSQGNQTLNDPIYNGTMYQFGLVSSNQYNSSLAGYGAGSNINNTWTVTYNVSGLGQFNFDDLFLSGVDPLNVEELGATKSLQVESIYGRISGKMNNILIGVAAVAGTLIILL